MASSFLEQMARQQAEKLEKQYGSSAYGGTTWLNEQLRKKKKDEEDDIAPVVTTKKEEEERTWFQKGALDDGFSLTNIGKSILGTLGDVASDLTTGVVGMGEKVVDAGAYLAGGVGKLVGADDFASDMEAFIKKDLYDERKVANEILSGLTAAGFSSSSNMGIAPVPVSKKELAIMEEQRQNAKDYLMYDAEEDSVLGDKSDALVQSAGQLGATMGLQAVGVPWFVTTGATSFGGEVENALNQGASYGKAGASAAISAGAEILSEKLSGGISFGGKTLDDLWVKQLTSRISDKTLRTMAKFGIDAVGEGTEEIISQVFSNLGSSLYREESLSELLASEEAIDEYIESFIGGAVLGGGSSVVGAVKANKEGVDHVTGMTANEQKVIDKVVEDRIAEEESDGKKLTNKEKEKIHDAVVSDMEKGYISTDTIEEVLGGETYKAYKDTVDSEDALQQEFDTLNKMKQGEMTGEQIDRRSELKAQLEEIKTADKRNQMKSKLGEEVFGLVQNDRLMESYNERGRRSQVFEVDLTKYDSKQQETVKKAVESGILNNTRRTHEFVDMIAKISADKGVLFDFANNQKLKDSGFAMNGKTVNGYVTKDGVTLNIDSAKALNSVVGHEITHVLEGTELYDALQQTIVEYAKSKGDYQGRYDSLAKLYEGVKDANVDAELTADLVGDYLFTDPDFINSLSTSDRNVFQKVYDEIKYLAKVATAGSKEARELEKVKRAFEKAYQESGKSVDGTRYSVSEVIGDSGKSYGIGVHLDSDLLTGLSEAERKQMVRLRVVEELSGNSFIAYDNGNPVEISIAQKSDKIKTNSNWKKPVLKELYNKYIGNETKQEAVVLADELIEASKHDRTEASNYSHDWLDNYGKNDWEKRTVYLQDKNNTVWEATLQIANSADGRKILYDIDPIEMAEGAIKSAPTTATTMVQQNGNNVKNRNSLSEQGEAPMRRSSFDTFGKDIRLETVAENATVEETAPNTETVLDNAETMFPADVPVQTQIERLEAEKAEIESKLAIDIENAELNDRWFEIQDRIEALRAEEDAEQTDRLASLEDADAPPELEAPIYEDAPFEDGQAVDVVDPFADRDVPHGNEGKKVNAYMYDNPEVKPFFQAEALALMEELNNGMKGERWYNDKLYYETRGDEGFGGTKRHQSESIDRLSYEFGLSYADIEKGLEAIIKDHGAENIAAAKKIEFVINDRLMYGYKPFGASLDPDAGKPNQDYIAMLQDKQRVDSLTDEYAPPVEEDIAPVFQNSISSQQVTGQQEIPRNRTREHIGADAPGVLAENARTEQMAFFEEPEVPKTITRKELHANILDGIKSTFKANGFDFDKVLKDAKNLSTFSTVDNTPQRVMEKALGYKEGQVLSDITVNKVAQNETEGIKWLNAQINTIKQISKQYGIKPGSKESAAAQMYAEGFYVDENNDIISYGDAELAKDFPNANVRQNIKRLASDPRIRQIYDDTLGAINESRTRNAYHEIPRLDNYFLHFRAMEDTFSRLGLPFNPNDIKAKDLPTDLNGVTADLKPGKPFFASEMHRTGKRTSFDLLGGVERYLNSAKNQIYHIDDIQNLRALRNYIADTYGQANGLSGLDALSEEEAQERIKEVYDSHLSTFAKFLNEEANVLAGKTALIDRGLEGIIGRRGITFLNTVNGQVGKNMVGFNVSSSLTNFLPVVQTFAKTNKADFVKAFGQTVGNKVGSIFGRTDSFAENSPVVIRRKGADRFNRTPWEKVSDTGYVFMSAVDDISTELIARTKYNELTRKGMESQKAHYETDKWVSRMMGDRSLGQQPQLYNSKMLGLITKFQLEVRNQLDSQFYDTIQEAKVSNEQIENRLARNAKTAAKVTSTFVQLAVAQHLFGKAFESVAGYNPAFDIIEVLMTAFGFDDDEDSEDTVLDNIEQGFLALLEDLPYTSTFTGGRIPISTALPIKELVTGKDEWGNEKSRWETLGEVAPYYVLPGGYGQIKKTTQGLRMFSEEHPIAGSYTDSGGLRFPVEDTVGNRIQAGIFGQYASENARDYFDNERSPLKEKQIQEFIDVDIPIRDYWDYREGLKEQETLEDKFDYIAGLDLPVEKKNILINNVVDRKNDVDMTRYEDFGSFEEFDFYSKNTEKYNFLQDNGVSYRQYTASEDAKEKYDGIYSWYTNYPDKVTVSKAVTDNVVEYREYTSALNAIRADKDANGKSISGSAKEKKAAYINGLDLDYGAKLILFKSEYNADDTYNYDIIDYLNGREDISYEEMVTILKELGFEVSGNNISW